jgi:hypothetical protein
MNAKKCRRRAPWEVSELEIRERPPSTLGNVDGEPPSPHGGIQDLKGVL